MMSGDSVFRAMRDGCALLVLPGARDMNRSFRAALLSALDEAGAEPDLRAVILSAQNGSFGDENADDATAYPSAAILARVIENFPKPVIAAVAGPCTGAGFELILAAHYRIANEEAAFSLPQVNVGLLPHAGGTQRLPRLVGLEKAVNVIVSGRSFPAGAFEGTKMLDQLARGDVVEAALKFAMAMPVNGPEIPRVRDMDIQDPQREAFMQFCRDSVASMRPDRGPAPVKGVNCIAAGAEKTFEEGLLLEAEAHALLCGSSRARALLHVAKAERDAASYVVAGASARSIGSVGVVGAGTMGQGIATCFANAGLPVFLLDVHPPALDRAVRNIRDNYDRSVKKGRMTEKEAEKRLSRISPGLDYAVLKTADLVIESVFEELEAKKAVLRGIDEMARPGAIIASNTSGLDLNVLAGFTKRPADVIGTHFFSPANVMRLLEVVRGRKTGGDVLQSVLALAGRIGKIPVVAGVCDGFIGNRMLARYVAAADRLIRCGALPQQVDKALESFGFAMGPFRMGDLAGLDIARAGRERRAAGNPGRDYASVADALCEIGRFGQKTNAGWYRYEPGQREAIPDPEVEGIIRKWRAENGIDRIGTFGAAEIVERCVYALANEGARILDEGIARSASDIDVAYVNGYGFPAYRGGPMFYAHEQGLPHVARVLRRVASEKGSDSSWEPAELLLRLAESGRSYFAEEMSV